MQKFVMKFCYEGFMQFIIYVSLNIHLTNTFYIENEYFDIDGIPFIPVNPKKTFTTKEREESSKCPKLAFNPKDSFRFERDIITSKIEKKVKIDGFSQQNIISFNTLKDDVQFLKKRRNESLRIPHKKFVEQTVSETKRNHDYLGNNSTSNIVFISRKLEQTTVYHASDLENKNNSDTLNCYNNTVSIFDADISKLLKYKNHDFDIYTFSKFFHTFLSLVNNQNPNLLNFLKTKIRNVEGYNKMNRNSDRNNSKEMMNFETKKKMLCSWDYCVTRKPDTALLIVSGKKLKNNVTHHKLRHTRKDAMDTHSYPLPLSVIYQLNRSNGKNCNQKVQKHSTTNFPPIYANHVPPIIQDANFRTINGEVMTGDNMRTEYFSKPVINPKLLKLQIKLNSRNKEPKVAELFTYATKSSRETKSTNIVKTNAFIRYKYKPNIFSKDNPLFNYLNLTPSRYLGYLNKFKISTVKSKTAFFSSNNTTKYLAKALKLSDYRGNVRNFRTLKYDSNFVDHSKKYSNVILQYRTPTFIESLETGTTGIFKVAVSRDTEDHSFNERMTEIRSKVLSKNVVFNERVTISNNYDPYVENEESQQSAVFRTTQLDNEVGHAERNKLDEDNLSYATIVMIECNGFNGNNLDLPGGLGNSNRRSKYLEVKEENKEIKKKKDYLLMPLVPASKKYNVIAIAPINSEKQNFVVAEANNRNKRGLKKTKTRKISTSNKTKKIKKLTNSRYKFHDGISTKRGYNLSGQHIKNVFKTLWNMKLRSNNTLIKNNLASPRIYLSSTDLITDDFMKAIESGVYNISVQKENNPFKLTFNNYVDIKRINENSEPIRSKSSYVSKLKRSNNIANDFFPTSSSNHFLTLCNSYIKNTISNTMEKTVPLENIFQQTTKQIDIFSNNNYAEPTLKQNSSYNPEKNTNNDFFRKNPMVRKSLISWSEPNSRIKKSTIKIYSVELQSMKPAVLPSIILKYQPTDRKEIYFNYDFGLENIIGEANIDDQILRS